VADRIRVADEIGVGREHERHHPRGVGAAMLVPLKIA
jgi:hypothetical protein